MNKRDFTNIFFISSIVISLVALFLPAIRIDVVREGVTHHDVQALVDANGSICCIGFLVGTAAALIFGKMILSSVLGFITCLINGFAMYYIHDMAETAARAYANGSLFNSWVSMHGVEGITMSHAFGFYIFVGSHILLAIMCLINLFVKDN